MHGRFLKAEEVKVVEVLVLLDGLEHGVKVLPELDVPRSQAHP